MICNTFNKVLPAMFVYEAFLCIKKSTIVFMAVFALVARFQSEKKVQFVFKSCERLI